MTHDLKLIGAYTYSRIMVVFRIRPAALQTRLPPPWEVADYSAGNTSEGGNLAVGFCDVLRIQDAKGQPTATPTNRYVIFNGPARNRMTGKTANMRYQAFAAHPKALLEQGPIAHPAAVPATFSVAARADGDDLQCTISEHIEITTETGLISVEATYRRGVPEPVSWQSDIVYPADPSRALYYHNNEFRDLLRSIVRGIDRVSRCRFQITVPELLDLFDGSESLVAITSVPWSMRQVSVQGG